AWPQRVSRIVMRAFCTPPAGSAALTSTSACRSARSHVPGHASRASHAAALRPPAASGTRSGVDALARTQHHGCARTTEPFDEPVRRTLAQVAEQRVMDRHDTTRTHRADVGDHL